MAKRALLLNDADNCVVAVEPVNAGDEVIFEGGRLTAQSSIALGHKLAIRPIAEKAKVVKYGASIGSARAAIAPGEHIHSHNLASDYITGFHFEGAGAATTAERVADAPRSDSPTPLAEAPARTTPPRGAPRIAPDRLISGYLRKDGRVGIRNRITVIYLVECAHHVARQIAEGFGADVEYLGFAGCYPSDYAHRLVRGLATHPNVGGVVLVSLGCECFDRVRLAAEIEASGRPCATVVIQENRGTTGSVTEGRRLVGEMREQIANAPRKAMTLADLVIGTVCGGSDGTSGITGNPAVGRAFDTLLAHGATCLFEESGELIGCESHMMERAATPAARDAIESAMRKASQYYSTMGLGSFSDGNAVGGLTTQEEKSLGAYAKSGASPIAGVLLPTEHPAQAGLYLMDVVPDGEPRFGYPNICDTAEIIELIATGCHLVVFTTGRGSVIGSAIAPVIKVCNNPETYRNMADDMDVDAGRIIDGGATLDEVADEIVTRIVEVAAGQPSCGERLGHVEYALTYKRFDYPDTRACRL